MEQSSQVFRDMPVKWHGREYALKADDILRTIRAIEETLTLGELADAVNARHFPYAKFAAAYACMLGMAGARGVHEEDIYVALLGKGAGITLLEVLDALQLVMLPPPQLPEMVKQDG